MKACPCDVGLFASRSAVDCYRHRLNCGYYGYGCDCGCGCGCCFADDWMMLPSCFTVWFGIAGAGCSRLYPEFMGFELGRRFLRLFFLDGPIRDTPWFKVLVLKGCVAGIWSWDTPKDRPVSFFFRESIPCKKFPIKRDKQMQYIAS